ncbi:rrna-processing fcf1 [Fusarium longipes]|uniref:Rrna-processing fcf1 n=1 Tax=Fusarium longipes TaxID=694270 RepID=A0A395T0F1_9HYPO|nr:rrna-processing fcf1 [Fusarium longipes]
MGVQKKTRKFAEVKRVIGRRDARLKENKLKAELAQKEKEKKTINGELIREAPQMPSNMFFQHNTALVPPYNVLVDTNFLSHSVQRKLSLLDSMMDCLYAKCNPIITSCVMAELEKLGPKYRLALRVARDERWTRLECDHKGVYADDCLVDRVQKNRIYIVGTNDKALKQRLRKIPGVPIMSVARANPNDNEQSSTSEARQKRTRVLLSCAPCRFSKLKCDREQPCSQCDKKGRASQCAYAPKPEKKRPARGMSARLKRLEGMVREMMDSEGAAQAAGPSSVNSSRATNGATGPEVHGHVVKNDKTTTYVGATHCMAMLEDIEDLKSYFDQPDDVEEDQTLADDIDPTELMLNTRAGPRNREELLSRLPDRKVADRLISRYFASMSPSQHIVHRPTFTRQYARFWQDTEGTSLHWIAQLFMMLSLGVFFNKFINSSELEGDSPLPALDRIRHYKACAGWALVWGKYTQPSSATLPAFLLYVESHFLFNRAAQMNCYVLSGVCMRLMLKMGLHRDPSKLANISPFEGEMRRRMWNMAIQVEFLVSFHMGLPSMLQGIETDTAVPRNLQDEDFDESSAELPPSRPSTEWTAMTYPIHKTQILRVFGQIARQAHALTPPSYVEVMKLDDLLQETWRNVPAFMMVRPLDECVGDPPVLLIQRFGLTALYNKCRCVLHRRYLAEAIPQREHDYSRRQCLEGALSLLNYQHIIWEASKHGHVLSQHGWFVSSLSVHDFLLAAMVIYLVIKNENHAELGSEYSMPTRNELIDMIKRSHFIWSDVSQDVGEVKKTADTLATMLTKLGVPVDQVTKNHEQAMPNIGIENESPSLGAPSIDPSTMESIGADPGSLSTLGLSTSMGSTSGQTPLDLGLTGDAGTSMSFPNMGTEGLDFDPAWMDTAASNMDWRYLDISLAHSHDAGRDEDTGQTWIERAPPLEQMDIMGSGNWIPEHPGSG